MKNDEKTEAGRYRMVRHAAWTTVFVLLMIWSGFRVSWPAGRWTWDHTAVWVYHAVKDDKPSVVADPAQPQPTGAEVVTP